MNLVCVLLSESYLDQRDAEGREKFLKSGSGHRFIEKQLKHFLFELRGDTKSTTTLSLNSGVEQLGSSSGS